jgi:polysaccharide transporter, PST family
MRTTAPKAMLWNLFGCCGIQFAGSVLPLLTVPYLARVLGPSDWGLALFFQALGLWLSVVIEYGFNLSGAREVAAARSAGRPLAGIVAAVMGAKLLLAAGCLSVAGLLALWLPLAGNHPEFLGWTLGYTLALGFSPFWYFQGVERVAGVAVIDLTARACAAAGTFVWVCGPGDGAKWMALQSLAAAGGTGIALAWMFHQAGCSRLQFHTARAALRDGLQMTFFRASTALCGSVNILVLGWLGLPATAGLFGGADKLARAESALLAPLSQVVYPRVSALLTRNSSAAKRLAARATTLAAGLAVCGAIAAFLFAPDVIRIALGPKFGAATTPFRVLQLCVPLAVLRNAVGMNWLLPMRRERSVGLFVLAGLATNLLMAAALGHSDGATGIAWAAVLSELVVLLGCLWAAQRTFPPALARGVSLVANQQECCR